MKHFNIIAEDGKVVGTIVNCSSDPHGRLSLTKRMKVALEEHFDVDVVLNELPDVFTNSPKYTMKIFRGGYREEISIMETWIY
jgi:hypothetical protein